MSEFIQLHILASYPPSNLNRDDLGRPKTAVMGGTQRLRVSSQSLKRAWRESELFEEALAGHIGIRTKEMGVKIKDALISGMSLENLLSGQTISQAQTIIPEKEAKLWAWKIAAVFVDKTAKKDSKIEETGKEDNEDKGKKSKKKSSNVDKETLKGEQLVFYSNNEISAIHDLINVISNERREPNKDELSKLLREDLTSVDIAMFGRMLANAPKNNIEAAVQVSHAITVHKVAVEDDYFTAVDDLNKNEENAGAGHIGETEFASGLFYNYVCINHTLLEQNLGGDQELGNKALQALVEAAAKVAPTGKQNSFASRAYASYILAEKGTQQPRSLSVAFLKALNGKDLLDESISALKATNEKMESVYGKCSESNCEMNAHTGEGTLSKVLDFVKA
ncbi:MAG: type I-E CRISPR-associated protein Cas7/Cse4/CasC [Candidatus Methanoperedens sp.]|nr:type I-E CRISPR-associated protein Cas7/Cse4/CasC [Candidatus Methanoperedens sp.]PKL53544.1 MAG: type I-E CRISPR-associated protein Cas7/Cse4/CasC [Candidatus Methanoperedenaceae archaeon HGW-Methanoperedenaceae-1]